MMMVAVVVVGNEQEQSNVIIITIKTSTVITYASFPMDIFHKHFILFHGYAH